MNKSLVIFSNDLRLSNQAVIDYVKSLGKDYIPVYLDYFQPMYTSAFFECNHAKRQFLVNSIEYLRRKLYLEDKELIVIEKDHKQALIDLLASQGCKQIYLSRNTITPLTNMLESIELMLLKNDIYIHYLDSNYFIDLQDLSFPLKNLPEDFQTFSTKVKGVRLQTSEDNPLVPEGILEILDDVQKASVPVLHPYKTELNNHFSKFFPYLTSGVVSPAELIEVIVQRSAVSPIFDKKTIKILTRQLVKLDFVRATIRNQMPVEFDEEDLSAAQVNRVEQWIEGKTQNDLINAIMHKLKETSMISLTSRKLTILYYLKVLKLPAFFGYEYFQTQLLEFDTSLNMYFWKEYDKADINQEELLIEINNRQHQLDPKQTFTAFWN